MTRGRGQAATCAVSILVAACAARPPARIPPAELPRSAASPAQAPGRVPAGFAYHFNRNALTASVRAANGDLLALTDSGNLLLFDAGTFALRAERVPRSPVACLGPAGATGVIVGLDDGRIVEVEVPSLRMKRVGEVDGEPTWIGRETSGTLLVAHGLAPEKPFGFRARGVASLTLEELGSARTIRLPFVGSAFLVDRKGRLWIGADNGEWGGHLAVIDLAAWSVREVEPKRDWQGVYGLSETADGHVWAYGGSMHMGGRGSFLAAVDREPVTTPFEMPFAGKPLPERPNLPITQVVPLPGGRSLLVLAYDQVFEVDASLASWRRLPKFEARYKPGRPDAVGSYPAARSVHLLGESPRRLAIATALDGWVELRGETYVSHRIAGQLGSSDVDGFANWAGRIVARGPSLDGGAWVLGREGCSEIEANSPVTLPETNQEKRPPASVFAPRSDGRLLAVFRDEPAGRHFGKPALLVTALCNDGHCEAVAQEQSLLSPDGLFVAPDDSAWALDDVGLWSFRDGRWVLVRFRGREGHPSMLPETRRIVAVVPTQNPPWVLQGWEEVTLFWPDTPTSTPRLTKAVAPTSRGAFSEEVDVVACAERLYVARSGGVCELDVATGKCSPTPLGVTKPVNHVGCDREGRLWLGGYGLSTFERGVATPVHDLDALVGGREIRSIGRDTGAGLPVAIEGRGVAILSAPGTAAGVPPPGADEGDKPFTPRPRQAVFLIFKPGKESDLVKPLDDALGGANAGAFAGYAVRPDGGARLVFYGPDAGRMVEIMRRVIERLGRKAVLVRRNGEADAPEQRIEIVPGAAASRSR